MEQMDDVDSMLTDIELKTVEGDPDHEKVLRLQCTYTALSDCSFTGSII